MTEMPDVLKLHADGTPDHHAVIVDASHGARSSVTTFAELNELVNRLVHGLRAAGVEQGDRLVWCGPNSLEVLAVIHAARKAGLVAVPLSYRFNSDEMQYVIDNSDATLVIADAEYAPLIDAARDRLPKVRAYISFVATEAPAAVPDGWLSWPEVIDGQPDEEPVAPDASTVGAQMLYTSGTTGKPKGALRTTTNREIVLALLAELGLQFGNEVHITTGPMYHSGPLAFASINHTLGAPIVVLRKFDPVAWLAAVKLHGATNTFSAPTQLKRVVSLPPERARARRPLDDAVPHRERGARPVRAQAGDHREARRRLPLRGVRLDRARDHHGAAPGRPAAQARFVREAVRRDRVPDREGRRHGRGPRENGELFMSTGLAMDGYHRTDEQLSEYDGRAVEVGG